MCGTTEKHLSWNSTPERFLKARSELCIFWIFSKILFSFKKRSAKIGVGLKWSINNFRSISDGIIALSVRTHRLAGFFIVSVRYVFSDGMVGLSTVQLCRFDLWLVYNIFLTHKIITERHFFWKLDRSADLSKMQFR